MHKSQSIETRGNIVQHNPSTFWKRLQLSHRRRLYDIEGSKKYKARQKRFPSKRHGDQSNQLTCNLIDHHKLWIFYPRASRNLRGGRNADKRNHQGQGDRRGHP